ncbi:MAG: hypothetical protein ACRCVN_00665 [Spirochaetia bacterium]
MLEENKETLVIASKIKTYIKTVSDMKCSTRFIEILSSKVKDICDEAIKNARNDQRKTVLDKDL